MQGDFRTILTGDAGVAALVGTRIYWNTLPQGSVKPSICLHLISEINTHTMGGTVDLEDSTVQVDCWAGTLADSLAVSEAAKLILDGYSGTVAATVFQGVFKTNERQDFSKPSNGNGELHRVSSDYQVAHA